MTKNTILFVGKAKDLSSYTAYLKNAYPNWTLEEYIKEVVEDE